MTRRRTGSSRWSGFTLIEMMIVIVILGILAMVIVPQISSSTDEAKVSTLRTNLSALRSAVEIYYAHHNAIYPASALPATRPADVTTLPESFAAQLTRYTDVNGNISNSKDATYKYGPYVKGEMSLNPFNEDRDVVVDNAETDITVKASDGTTGWKFYSLTGVFMANDGAHDAE